MRLFVKICGVTDPEAALAAAAAGADAVGFVFHPPSRRYLTPAAAGALARLLGDGPARVGVFVDAPLGEVVAAARAAGLDWLQFHGRETPAYCRAARRRTGCRVIKALPVGPDGPPRLPVWAEGDADFFLLDAPVPGGGRPYDWSRARAASLPAPVLLAGGLTPENVAEALEAARPAGVDVSSGVETGGRKDPEKIRAFVARVRRWEHERR